MIKQEYIDAINKLFNNPLDANFINVNEISRNNALNWLDENALSNRLYYIFPKYGGGILIEYVTPSLNVTIEFHNNGEIEIITTALD